MTPLKLEKLHKNPFSALLLFWDGNLPETADHAATLTWLKCSWPRSSAPCWDAAPRRSSRRPSCAADRLRLVPNTLSTSSLKASSGPSEGRPRLVAAKSSSPATARPGAIVGRAAPKLADAGTRARRCSGVSALRVGVGDPPDPRHSLAQLARRSVAPLLCSLRPAGH